MDRHQKWGKLLDHAFISGGKTICNSDLSHPPQRDRRRSRKITQQESQITDKIGQVQRPSVNNWCHRRADFVSK